MVRGVDWSVTNNGHDAQNMPHQEPAVVLPACEDTLVLVYGMACPLKCDFCCHPVEEYGPVKMTVDEAIDWIGQAAHVASVKRVVFTGGEPFLYYRDLLAILEATQHVGLPVRIVTAAHWATDVEKAMALLRPLKERGLAELSVSTDPSHQAFVPRAYAEYAIQAAQKLGLICEIAAVFWHPGQNLNAVVTIPDGVGQVVHLAVPIGRGKHRAVSPAEYGIEPSRFGACGRPRQFDVTIYPDGNVYPCCSGGFNIQAKLSFGNLGQEPLSVIIDRIHHDRYVRVLFSLGLTPIYELARQKFPELLAELPDPSPYVSICQLCARIHSDTGVLAKLDPLLNYATKLLAAWHILQEAWKAEQEAQLSV
jgi:hypothetical protein